MDTLFITAVGRVAANRGEWVKNMKNKQISEKKEPKKLLNFVLALTIVFALLIYWFLGFLMEDISSQPGPFLEVLQKKYQDPLLVKERDAINKQLNKLS